MKLVALTSANFAIAFVTLSAGTFVLLHINIFAVSIGIARLVIAWWYPYRKKVKVMAA